MRFNFGKVHYGENLHHVNINLDDCTVKFQRNYWGFASAEQWKANKIALVNGQGEIRAEYKNEEGIILHIINFDVLTTKHTIFCTQEDLDNGFHEQVVKRITEQIESKRPRKKGVFTIGHFA